MARKKSALKTNDAVLEREKNEVMYLLRQFMVEMRQWELACLEALEDVDLQSDELALQEKHFKSDLANIYEDFAFLKIASAAGWDRMEFRPITILTQKR